jgi:hypothetical protein
MKPTALKNGERIKLLVAMVGSTNNGENYYKQLVVVSQETGDAVYFLVPFDRGLNHTNGDKTFNCFSAERQTAKLSLTEPKKLASITNFDSNATEFPRFKKVIYGSQYEPRPDKK